MLIALGVINRSQKRLNHLINGNRAQKTTRNHCIKNLHDYLRMAWYGIIYMETKLYRYTKM